MKITKSELREIIREEIQAEAGGRIPKLFMKIGAVENEINRLKKERSTKYGGAYAKALNNEKNPIKREKLLKPIRDISDKIQDKEKNLRDLRNMENDYYSQMAKNTELDLHFADY